MSEAKRARLYHLCKENKITKNHVDIRYLNNPFIFANHNINDFKLQIHLGIRFQSTLFVNNELNLAYSYTYEKSKHICTITFFFVVSDEDGNCCSIGKHMADSDMIRCITSSISRFNYLCDVHLSATYDENINTVCYSPEQMLEIADEVEKHNQTHRMHQQVMHNSPFIPESACYDDDPGLILNTD